MTRTLKAKQISLLHEHHEESCQTARAHALDQVEFAACLKTY